MDRDRADAALNGTDLFGKTVRRNLTKGLLGTRFLLPPFSVLNAREGPWQSRKRAWIALGIQSELGRGGNLLSISDSCEEYRQREGDYAEREEDGPLPTASLKGGLTFGLTQAPYADPEEVKKKRKSKKAQEESALMPRPGHTPVAGHTRVQGPSQPGLTNHLTCQAYRKRGQTVSASDCGTSIFDPVLTELLYTWFCPAGGQVIDPFAGGSVRGIVAAALGRRYWGNDLSERQVVANRIQGKTILGEGQTDCVWNAGDSRDEMSKAPKADMVMSCPPYADLEVYSKDPRDISNMDHEDFLDAYKDIIYQSCERLAPDRFAAWVVGDVRDKNGLYRDLPGDTVRAFRRAGLSLYNQMILVTSVGSLSIRVTRQFEKSRKVGTTHQVVQVFLKGDGRRASVACGGTG